MFFCQEQVTTINQETAEVGKEPLKVLNGFRVGQLLSPEKKMKGQVSLSP
jgi:hypothetical protein